MARFKPIDMSPRILAVDLHSQVLPGTFEFALCRLIDHEFDLSELEARFCNDVCGATAYAPSVLLKIVLLACSRGIVSSRAMQLPAFRTCCSWPSPAISSLIIVRQYGILELAT